MTLRGHAIECRINAEDVGKGFLPAPGLITAYEEPSGPGVRVDSGVRAGDEISGLYDPMIAKLIVHDTNRETARRRMLRALAEFRIEGPPTLLGFHAALLTEPCFVDGGTCHGLVESEELAQRAEEMTESFSHQATSVASVGGRSRHAVSGSSRSRSTAAPSTFACTRPSRRGRRSGAGAASAPTAAAGAGSGAVVSPMQGTVLKVLVADGDAGRRRAGALRDRGDEDGERDRRPARDGIVHRARRRRPAQGVTNGQLICVVAAAA